MHGSGEKEPDRSKRAGAGSGGALKLNARGWVYVSRMSNADEDTQIPTEAPSSDNEGSEFGGFAPSVTSELVVGEHAVITQEQAESLRGFVAAYQQLQELAEETKKVKQVFQGHKEVSGKVRERKERS